MGIPVPKKKEGLMKKSIVANFRNLLGKAREVRCKRKDRAMHLCETLSLGDRRFLALVKIEGQRFLIGAAGSSISLLAEISSPHNSETLTLNVESNAPFDDKECKLWK